MPVGPKLHDPEFSIAPPSSPSCLWQATTRHLGLTLPVQELLGQHHPQTPIRGSTGKDYCQLCCGSPGCRRCDRSGDAQGIPERKAAPGRVQGVHADSWHLVLQRKVCATTVDKINTLSCKHCIARSGCQPRFDTPNLRSHSALTIDQQIAACCHPMAQPLNHHIDISA